MKLEGFQNVVHNSWVSPTQRMDSAKKKHISKVQELEENLERSGNLE